jgi:membrane associated rhomboid family serine protease
MNLDNIKYKLKRLSIVEKYIYVFIFVFVLTYLFQSVQTIQNDTQTNKLIHLLALYNNIEMLPIRFYTLVTYSFIHINFFHLVFNLIVFYHIGNLFISFFSKKQFHIYYIFGSLFGGIFFITASNLWLNTSNNILIGASAGITSFLVALAVKAPNYEVNIRFIRYVKLWILTIIWIAISFISIPNNNAGGQIAHLGGAFFGLVSTILLIKQPLFNKNKSTLKAVYKKSDYGLTRHQKDRLHQQKVDYLLDKISKSGYNSLTKPERDFLARASKK